MSLERAFGLLLGLFGCEHKNIHMTIAQQTFLTAMAIAFSSVAYWQETGLNKSM